MKGIFRDIALISVLLFACLSCLAKKTQLVYGLERAEDFKASTDSKVYIQAQSFLSKARAIHYKNFIAAKIDYPVKITHEAKFNVVTIGPISSAEEVRKTAQMILGARQSSDHEKHSSVTSTSLAFSKVSDENSLLDDEFFAPDEPWTPDEEFLSSETSTKNNATTNLANSTTANTGDSPDNEFSSDISTPEETNASKDKFAAEYINNFFISVGGGEQFQNFDSTIYVNNNSGFPPPSDQDIYSTSEDHQPVFATFIGLHGRRDQRWLPAYASGLFYQHSFTTNIGNTIMQNSDPNFINYNDDWDVASDLLLSLMKVNIVKMGKFSPYVLGGLGVAFNRSSDYQEYPINGLSTARVSPNFSSHTTGQFAYSAGAGIDFSVCPQVIFSAEYQYQNLGKISTGNGTGAWSGQSLSLDSYHVNALLLNMSFLFGQ